MLTPESGVAAFIVALSPDRPSTIIVAMNDRDPTRHDSRSIDLASGQRERVFENNGGYNGQIFDYSLSLRLLRREDREAGGTVYFRYDEGRVEKLFEVAHEDDVGTYVAGFERNGTHFLLGSSVGRNTSALFRVDVATGERAPLAEHAKADLQGAIRDPRSGRVLAVNFEHTRREWVPIDPAVADDWRRLAGRGRRVELQQVYPDLRRYALGRHLLRTYGAWQLPPV